MSHRVARVGGSQADILSTAVAQHAKKAHPKARRYREAVVTWVNGSLVLASLVCGFVGWKLGAASPQAPATPATFEVHVSALSLPHYRPPSHIDVLTSLHQLGRNYTALGVVVSAGFPATTQVYWNINFVWATAQSLAPNICEPDKADVPGMGPLTPPQMTTGSYLIQGTSPSASGPGEPLFGVNCHWNSKVGITTSGPYTTALVPAVDAGLDNGELTRELFLDQHTVDYSLQTESPPTLTYVNDWQWSVKLTQGAGSTSSSPIPLSAADLAGLQWQSKKVFIGGVLLGIAAGAVVALMTNVLGVVDNSRKRRLKRRRAEAGHGTESAEDMQK